MPMDSDDEIDILIANYKTELKEEVIKRGGKISKSDSSSDEDDGIVGTESGEQVESGDAFQQLDELDIKRPKTEKEKQLMSLVFGGRAEIVSNLIREGAADDDGERSEPDTDSATVKRDREAAWHDSDDDIEDVVPVKRSKTASGKKVTNDKRRKVFERLVGNPKWADLDREREVDSDDEILKTAGHVVERPKTSDLTKDTIELKKLKNLNRETKHEGEITAVNFHPTSMVAVISGKSGMVSIVAVDGKKNEKLHAIGLQKFQIACCCLSPDGNEIIFGSYRKFYHLYNLISGSIDSVRLKDDGPKNMMRFVLSACGKFLAVAGIYGEVHILEGRSKEQLFTIQQRYQCSSLAFTPDSKLLFCHSFDSEVTVYDMEKRRIINTFVDDGCVNGSCVTVCPNGTFVATGSRQGIANVYQLKTVMKDRSPVPQKTIANLTTTISSIVFNATSELLAIASSDIPNAVKLIHVKSGSVYRNFPMMKADLGHITALQFSPGGGYFALGNRESVVSLFRVKHYDNY